MSLFLDNVSYVAAITLAGAAEEVFGKALQRSGKTSVLNWKIDEMNIVSTLLHRKTINRKKFIAHENKIRNALKHFNDCDNETIVLDLEYSACWMLVRVCENASRLGIAIARVKEFNDWFYSNVVGI